MKPKQCDFCDGQESKHLIVGTNEVYICDKCVADAVAIVAQLYRKERENLKTKLVLTKVGV